MQTVNVNVSFDEISRKINIGEIARVPSEEFVKLVKLLEGKGKTVSVAESCTGGLMGKLITDVSGASSVFCGGIISYTNDVKTDVLGVSKDTIKEHTEVSYQTAAEMAIKAREKFKADFAISATGFAGPRGGREDAPVGTVFVGISGDKICRAFKLNVKNSGRDFIRLVTASFAAHKLSEILCEL